MQRLTEDINKIVKSLIVILFTLLIFVGLLQVISRYVFNLPIIWADEFQKYTFIYLTMIGAAYAEHLKKHVSADVVLTKAGPRIAHILEFIIDALTVFLFIVLVYLAPKMVYLNSSTISPTLNIPMGYIYISMFVGPLLMLYYKIAESYEKYFTSNKERRK